MRNGKKPSNNFSESYKYILAYAMDRAYFLGSTAIEPIHLLLGEMDSQYSLGISSHLFRDRNHLDKVIESYRLGEPIIIPHPDELMEKDLEFVEKVIRKSFALSKQLGGGLVEPYHLFLALEKINPCFFKEISKEENFRLKDFYFNNYGLNLSVKKWKVFKKIIGLVYRRQNSNL